MNNFTRLLAPAVLALTFASCNDSQFDGFTRAENGLHYKFFNHDENGTMVQDGDKLMLRYVISRQSNDSIILDSKEGSRDGSGFMEFFLRNSSFPGSFEDGMKMMAKGDSAEFIIRADSFFIKSYGLNELPKGFTANDYLKGVFKIKDIIPAKEVAEMQQKQMEAQKAEAERAMLEEKTLIEKYVAENKITVKPEVSGLYFVETKKGTGGSPSPEDMVTVNYVGKFLNGEVFDASEKHGGPATFALNRVIPGWTEALQKMKKGGKANLLIPSSIAYGPGGNGMPPYAPLFFEVELIDFQAAPAAPATPEGHGPGDGHNH